MARKRPTRKSPQTERTTEVSWCLWQDLQQSAVVCRGLRHMPLTTVKCVDDASDVVSCGLWLWPCSRRRAARLAAVSSSVPDVPLCKVHRRKLIYLSWILWNFQFRRYSTIYFGFVVDQFLYLAFTQYFLFLTQLEKINVFHRTQVCYL